MQEAARRRQLGDPGAVPDEGSPYSRTEVPRGTAAEQAVLERLALFDALSARNNDKQVAVLEFKAGEYKRLNAFFLLTEEPAAYNLPEAPTMPTNGMKQKYMWSAAVGLGLSLVSAIVIGRKR